MPDLFYVRPLAHSFKTRYAYICRWCGSAATSPNRRATGCQASECREKARERNVELKRAGKWAVSKSGK